MTTCQHPDECPRPVKAFGWCRAHWDRIGRSGSAGSVEIATQGKSGRPCRVDDCPGVVDSTGGFGYCGKHYQRVARHGSPDVVLTGGASMPGELNPNWSGSQVSYSAMHLRLRRERGSASAFDCFDCGAPARHWSYDNADPGETIGAEGLRYSVDTDHYQPRCVPCHSARDSTARIALLTGERPAP